MMTLFLDMLLLSHVKSGNFKKTNNMSYIVVDVKSDGPVPPIYSMVCFGAVVVSDPKKTFYGKVLPISNNYDPDALAISGFTRYEHSTFQEPRIIMPEFREWVIQNSIGKPVFISDNLAYDWQWINYYFHAFCVSNPFGFSGRRIGDLYCGMKKNASLNHEWKKLYRKTRHTHNPVDDAMGNAEALLAMKEMGLKIEF